MYEIIFSFIEQNGELIGFSMVADPQTEAEVNR